MVTFGFDDTWNAFWIKSLMNSIMLKLNMSYVVSTSRRWMLECTTHMVLVKDEGCKKKKKMNTTSVAEAMEKQLAYSSIRMNFEWLKTKEKQENQTKCFFPCYDGYATLLVVFFWEIYTIKRFSFVLFTSLKELSKRKSEKWYKFRFMLYLIFYTALLILFSTLFFTPAVLIPYV